MSLVQSSGLLFFFPLKLSAVPITENFLYSKVKGLRLGFLSLGKVFRMNEFHTLAYMVQLIFTYEKAMGYYIFRMTINKRFQQC